MKKDIAFVVQRYGLEINGGSELHCRQLAERLTKQYEVTVLTTCAEDYMTWENVYPAGKENINNVHVIRFRNDHKRNIKKFNKVSLTAFSNPHNIHLGREWQAFQGPVSSPLLQYLSENKDKFDAIICMTYLYYPSYTALHIAPEKSILIPTAHDELPITLNVFNSEFHLPKYIIYNTATEMEFIHNRFHNQNIPSTVAGVGIDIPDKIENIDLAKEYQIDSPYMVYVGRIDESKGCRILFEHFLRYKKETKSSLKLVLAGKTVMEVPTHKDILSLGFVSDELKYNLIKNAKFLVLPSLFESLSMSTLEAMALNTPVLLNGDCLVLKDHCIQSEAGFYFHRYEDFKAHTEALLNDPNLRKEMGKKGREYVHTFYQWDSIIDKITHAIEYVSEK